jgi:antibiotic biosynthesis monooxygenase (ABM) superfamily enzyme
MAVTTLIGVFPTSLLLTIAVAPLIHTLPLLLRVLTIAACMVALLTWVVMPFVTRVLHGWLHKKAHSA